VLMMVVVLVILLAGGCGVLVATLGVRAVDAVTAPLDVANAYLDAARSGGDLSPHACSPEDPPLDEVVSSRGQQLRSVEISGGLAEVRGTLRPDPGIQVPVRVSLARDDDGWCVSQVLTNGP